MKRAFAYGLATWFGCGYVPVAPGTAGTLGGLALAYLCGRYFGWHPLAYAALALAALAPAIWSAISQAVTTFSDERVPLSGTMTRVDQSLIAYAAMPLPDGATLLTFRDITDAKRYERALEERNEALITADRLKSQFIGHVSYELRTPLTNIIGFGDLLATPRTGSLNPKQRDYLADISVSSRTLLAIIDDILDLATIDAGALDLKLSPSNVREILDQAILGVAERAQRSDVMIEVDVASDATEFVADPARVRQVIYNLLSNAIGFSQAGQTVRITAKRDAHAISPRDYLDREQPGLSVGTRDDMITFTVADQGVGIPLDQQARIFERFTSFSQGARHRGAGLGLPIVKSLVELHGGTAAIDSTPGRGTKVIVRFPDVKLPGPEGGPDDAGTPSTTVAVRVASGAAETSMTIRKRTRKRAGG